MSSFTRHDYEAVFAFAREQYFWHESTGRSFDLKAAIVMEKCEEVLGQQISFPKEVRKRLLENSKRLRDKLWNELAQSNA